MFARTTDLVQKLQIARRDIVPESAIAKLDKYHLLILDDLAYVCKDQAETSVLFELISARYERRSLLITANQPFDEWGRIFPDQAMTLAAIDRLVHHATIFEMNVDSYRRKAAVEKTRDVGRPALSAFDATAVGGTLNLIFSSPAGSWTHTNGNANIVPVVANGLVYVASDKALTIFGVVRAHAALQTAQTAVQPSPVASLASPHEITGTLLAISGSTLTLQTRTGKSAKIYAAQAIQNEQVAPLFVGQPFTALGSSFDANGALVATSIVQAKGSSGELWPPDLLNPSVPIAFPRWPHPAADRRASPAT